MKERYYRPDWYRSPDCPGDEKCDGKARCPVFGLPGMCLWPCPIVSDNFDEPFWNPVKDASLAEGWLPR